MILQLLLACSSPDVADVTRIDPSQPDLVLVVIDTLRADHLGVYGHSRATSPVLDRLAGEGLWFRRAYAHSGWTLPSFTSLFTGLLPHEHRIGRADDDASQFSTLPPQAVTLAERLAAAGYATGAVVNNTFLAPDFGLDQGFDLYDYQGSDALHRSAADTVALGLAWLNEQEKPAFLVLHFMEPHSPLDPPAPARGRFATASPAPLELPLKWDRSAGDLPTEAELDYMLRLYDEEILASDQALGALVEGLEARDASERTVLAVTADHGEEFWDHGGYEHGHTLFGELTRVPLVLWGSFERRGAVDQVVHHMDLHKTLLTLADAGAPEPTEALDLLSASEDADRVAVSENCLYRSGCLSMVDRVLRLRLRLGKGTAEVWRVAEDGHEREEIPPGPANAVLPELLPRLKELRGDFEPLVTLPGPRIDSRETWQQLKSLGYLGDEPPP